MNTFRSIDWKAQEACLVKRPSVYITSIVKLIHRWQPTLTKTSKYEKLRRRITRCLCGKLETQHHYIYCEDEQFVTARKNKWLKFRSLMQRWKIHDSILLSMWTGMESWRNQGENVICPDLPFMEDSDNELLSEAIKIAYDCQNKIGWYHFHLGRISLHWKRCIRL